jgi:selenocysteine-specific elongation factor
VASGRKNIMLGTAGHVDHGKTALVKLLTGCETDTLAEEKQRGLTIDLGFAPCRLADERIVGVVDVPGHVDFIRNMVAGAHGIDVVILVVAADDGIMPQTHEHLHILTLMGLKHGLVALTKIDLVDSARQSEVIQDLRRLLAGTFLAEAPFCPVSNITGEGYGAFFDALNEVVNACAERPLSGEFRVWVEDVFSIRGTGTVITGIPSSGVVREGDALTLLPAGRVVRVRRMQVYGQVATEARAGECVALNLPELETETVRRGMVLTSSESMNAVSMAEAELRILELAHGRIKDFSEVHLHVGTASVSANLAMLENTEMTAGQKQFVQLRMTEPIPVIPGERFVVRANLGGEGQTGLVTIGGGRILAASNARLRRRKQWILDSLAARRDDLDDPLRWCERMLREETSFLSARELQGKCFLRANELAPLLEQLIARARVLRLAGGCFVHADNLEASAAKIITAIQSFHAANPQRAGITREELFATAGIPAELFDPAVESLVRSARVQNLQSVFSRADWTARLSDLDEQLCKEIETAFLKAGYAGPTSLELAARLRQTPERIERMLKLLTDRSVLVLLDQRTFLHRNAFEAAKCVVLDLFRKKPAFTTMDFRDALGVSRKYAVPLLDCFDRVRFTVRSGHDRSPGVEAKKLLNPIRPA